MLYYRLVSSGSVCLSILMHLEDENSSSCIGWTSFPSIHWIVPTLAIGCATMGIFSIYLAVFNYLADTYHRYASSALAAQSFCRNMLGGVFPLVTGAMFHRMTFAGASSFLGGVVNYPSLTVFCTYLSGLGSSLDDRSLGFSLLWLSYQGSE